MLPGIAPSAIANPKPNPVLPCPPRPPAPQLDRMLDLAACQIVSFRSNACFDAYVLSESSLFVYPDRMVGGRLREEPPLCPNAMMCGARPAPVIAAGQGAAEQAPAQPGFAAPAASGLPASHCRFLWPFVYAHHHIAPSLPPRHTPPPLSAPTHPAASFRPTPLQVLKTCGTTKLLACVPLMEQLGCGLGMAPCRVKYTRASYLFPDQQPEMHGSFEAECALLHEQFGRLGRTSAYVLGDALNGLQWHVFVAGPGAAAAAGCACACAPGGACRCLPLAPASPRAFPRACGPALAAGCGNGSSGCGDGMPPSFFARLWLLAGRGLAGRG